MGRPKKIIPQAAPAKKTAKKATVKKRSAGAEDRSERTDPKVAIRRQLAAVRAEIQRIHAEDSPAAGAVALRLAELHGRVWNLEELLATDVNVRLACARQAASWAEQQIRAAKAISVDILRDLWAKAEQMQRHQGALKDLK